MRTFRALLVLLPLIAALFLSSMAHATQAGFPGRAGPVGGGNRGVDIDFTLASSLPSYFDFTRTSGRACHGISPTIFYLNANQACLDRDPLTGAAGGLLVEGSRTNSLTRSSELDQWTGNAAHTVVTDTLIAPDGTLTVDTISTSSVAGGRYRTVSGLISGTTYTLSGYFKYVSGTQDIGFGADSTNFGPSLGRARIRLNPANCTFISSETAVTAVSFQTFANGWCRASLTATLSNGTSFIFATYPNSGPAGYRENGMWGFGVEPASFPSSHVSTTSAAVTRAPDIATTSNLSALGFNPSEGTIIAEYSFIGVDSSTSQRVLQIDDGSDNNRLLITYTSGQMLSRVSVSSSDVASLTTISGVTANATYRTALAYKANDFATVTNGGTVFTDTSGAVPTSQTTLRYGRAAVTPFYGFVHLRRLTDFPTRLPDAELQRRSQVQ